MIFEILYLENWDKARFFDLKKRVETYYVLKKSEHPSTVTKLQSLLLNYQHNYNSNRTSQSNGVRNNLMFAQHNKNKYDKGYAK